MRLEQRAAQLARSCARSAHRARRRAADGAADCAAAPARAPRALRAARARARRERERPRARRPRAAARRRWPARPSARRGAPRPASARAAPAARSAAGSCGRGEARHSTDRRAKRRRPTAPATAKNRARIAEAGGQQSRSKAAETGSDQDRGDEEQIGRIPLHDRGQRDPCNESDGHCERSHPVPQHILPHQDPALEAAQRPVSLGLTARLARNVFIAGLPDSVRTSGYFLGTISEFLGLWRGGYQSPSTRRSSAMLTQPEPRRHTLLGPISPPGKGNHPPNRGATPATSRADGPPFGGARSAGCCRIAGINGSSVWTDRGSRQQVKFCQMLSWRLLRVAASPERRSQFPPSDLPFALSNTP